jgi:hypothetical protein
VKDPFAVKDPLWPRDLDAFREWLFSSTFCRARRHCRPRNRVRKFDGGRCPELCRNCRLIVGTWRDQEA